MSSPETVCLLNANQVVKVSSGTCQQSVEVLSKSVTYLDFRLSHSSVATLRTRRMGLATGECGGTMSPHFWDQWDTGGIGGGPMKMIFASTAVGAENDGHENIGPEIDRPAGIKLQDMKMTDQMTGHEIAGRAIAGHENARRLLFCM